MVAKWGFLSNILHKTYFWPKLSYSGSRLNRCLAGSKNMKKNVIIMLAVLLIASGCGKSKKQPQDMSFEELKVEALANVNGKNSDVSISCLEQMIAKYPEHQDIFEYKFMLAELYLKVGRLDEAYSLYKNYTEFCPADARAEEAHYKSVLSKFYQTLKVSKSCDDSDTAKTLKRCKDYLANNSYSKYAEDVRDIQYTCERRLIDKEIYVFDTYLRQSKFQSAQKRLADLRETYLPKHPGLEAQILYLESKLAHTQKNAALVQEKVGVLLEKYPESRFTKMAHGLAESKSRKFDF